ncbi:hypothetical protein, variant [Fonticula alba]|uniref:Uncharacterized protein n=1 Tax=Fonticula alba TaxID=691883 RepID=A0A058ZFW7_FONAL|nr:hypothetical protein, variant [Fonticula alba]KCV72846.1 hypothetical protein, variant [Fonticula alba]|eukprot:XP_009492547.1 hypothetical protein, variant [Fonticula alba]
MPSEPGSPMTGSNGSLNRVPPAVDIPRSPASPHWMERSPEASPPGVGGSPIGPGGGMSYPDSPAGSGAPWWPETGPGGSTSDLSDAGWSPGDDDPTGSRAAMDSASSATPMTTVPAAFVTVSPQDFLQYHRAPGSRSDMTNYGSHMPAGTVQFFTDSAVRPWRDYFLRLEFSRDTALPHLALYPRLKSRHPTIIPLFSALRIFLHGTPPPGASVQLRDCYSAGVPDVPPPRNMSHSHMFAIQTAGHLHHFCSVDMAESWVLALRQLRATARFRVLGPPRDPPPRAAYYLPPAAQAEPAVAPAAESPLPSPAPGAGDLQVPVFFLPPHRLTGDQMVSLRVGLSVIRAAAADLASPLHPPAFHFLDPLEESIPASDWPFECQLFKHLPMSMLCSSSATLVESIVTNLYFHFASFIASWSASTGDRPVAERGAAASRSQAAGTSSLEDALQSALRGSDVSTDDETFGGPGSDLAPEDIPHTTEGHFDAFADSHLFDSLLLNSSLDETVGKVRASWRLVAFTAASQSFLSITDLVNRVNTDILALVFVPVDPLFDSVALIPLSFSRSHPCFQDTGGSESPTDGTICSCALDSLSRLPLPVSTLQRLLQASPGSISCPEGAVSSVGAICERSRDVFLVLRMRAPVGLPPVSAMIPEQPVSSRNPTPLAYAQRMGALPVTGDLALRAVGLAGLLGQPVDVRQQPGSLFARDADHAAAMVSLCLGEWGAQAVTTAAAAAAAVSGVDPFAPLQHLSALGVAPAFARAAAEPAVGAQLLRLAQDTTAKFRRGATSGGGLLRRHRLFGSGATAAGAATDPELDPGRGGAPAGTAVLLPDCPRLSFEAQHSLFHLVLGYSARRLSAHVSTLPRALPMAAAPAATVAASPPASMPGTSYQPPVESPPGSPGRLFAEEVDSSASTDLDNGSGDEGADDGGTTGDGEFSDSDTEPPAGDPAGPSSPSSPAILAPVRGPSPGPAPAKASAGTPPPADQLFQPDSSSDESCAESLFETINPLDAVPPGEAALPPELQLIQHQDTDEDPDADDMVEEAGPGVLDAPLAVLTSHRSRLNLVSQPSGPAVAPSSVLGPAAEEADGPGAGAPVGPSVAELAHKRRADFALEVAHGHAQSARCLRRLMELSAAGDQLRLDPQALLLSAWQHIEPGSESGSDGGGGNVQGHVAGEVVASPGPGGPEGKGAAAAAAAAAAAGLPPLCGTAHLALERSSAGGWRRPMPGPQRPPGAPFLAAGLATPPSELEDGSAPGAYDAIPELGHILGLEAFDAACPAGLGTSFDLTIHSPEVLATLLPAVVYPDLAGRLAGHSPPKAALLDGGSALATVRMAGAGARLTLHADGRWRCSSRHLPAAGDLLSFSEGQRRRGFAAPWLRDLSSGRHRDIAAVPIQCGLDFHRLPLFAGQPPGHRTMGPASTPPPSPGGEVLPEPAPELARSWCWLGVASPGDLPAAGALDGLAAVVLSLARVPAAGGDTPGTGSPVAGQWVLRAHHPDTLLLLAGWDLVAELSAPASPEALESGPAVVPGGPPGGAVFRGSTRLDRLSAAVESAVAALTSADLFPEPSGDALSSSEGEDAEVHAEGSSPRLAGPGAASSGRSPSLDAGPSGDLRLHGQFLALGAMEFRPVGRELSGLGDLPLLSPDFSLAPGPAPAEVCPIDSVQDSQLLQPIDPANFFSSLLRSYAFVLDFLLVQQQSPVVEPECLSMWKCASDGAPVGPGPGPSPAAGPASGALGASDKRSFLSSLMDTVSVVRPGFGDGPAGGDSSGGVAAGGAPLSLLSPAAGHPVRSARAFGRQCLCPDALSREIRAGLFDACCQVLVSDVRLGVSPPHEVLLDSPVDLAWWQAWQAVLLGASPDTAGPGVRAPAVLPSGLLGLFSWLLAALSPHHLLSFLTPSHSNSDTASYRAPAWHADPVLATGSRADPLARRAGLLGRPGRWIHSRGRDRHISHLAKPGPPVRCVGHGRQQWRQQWRRRRQQQWWRCCWWRQWQQQQPGRCRVQLGRRPEHGGGHRAGHLVPVSRALGRATAAHLPQPLVEFRHAGPLLQEPVRGPGKPPWGRALCVWAALGPPVEGLHPPADSCPGSLRHAGRRHRGLAHRPLLQPSSPLGAHSDVHHRGGPGLPGLPPAGRLLHRGGGAAVPGLDGLGPLFQFCAWECRSPDEGYRSPDEGYRSPDQDCRSRRRRRRCCCCCC